MLTEVERILVSNGYRVADKTPRQDGLHNLTIGNRSDVIRLLGSVRPKRLLAQFDPDQAGAMYTTYRVRLVKKEFIGDQPVISIATDAKTYIAEGLASHNCDYDWVVFAQLFGTMIALPEGWPMYCRDLKQWCDQLGNPKLPEQDKDEEHHALNDARWVRSAYFFLQDTALRFVSALSGAVGVPLRFQRDGNSKAEETAVPAPSAPGS